MTRRIIILAASVVLIGTWTGPAQGQEANSNAVWNNADAGFLAERAPGRLVNDATARHRASLAQAFSPPEITATDQDRAIVTGLKVAAIQALFDNLNALLLFFDNAIRVQAGFPVYVPSPIRPGGGGGGLDLGSLGLGDLLGQL
ncbi:MAG TPA: hypothetical protein VM243_01225 [Phycisphaerae bacterium]|nr:hypothetical protein [Phycisphaerae bacterium]